MGTKTISIMDDVYELLVRHKKPNESFSEEFRRLVPKRGNIMECAGLWAHMSDKEAEDMKRNIEDFGKKFTKSLLKRTNRL
ncbi:antitoxin VapB family protein [Candidatus Woesearchaeota archaeon]|nr:antitoxin VapB family protein [Candidatus Woesearchaeota archaeon]